MVRGISVDQLRTIWFTENVTNQLARFNPVNNNFTEWSIPGGGNPRYIITNQAPAGTQVYFTEYSSNKIGYFDSWNGTFYEWQLPTGSNPVGVYVDADYAMWFTESGRDAIGRLSPSTNQLTEWTLPGGTNRPGIPLLEPWGIYVTAGLTGPHNNVTEHYVWFTELTNNVVGRLQATNNLLTLWNLNTANMFGPPGLNFGPMDIMVDSTSAGNVVFSASTGDRISVLRNCGNPGSVPGFCTGYEEYLIQNHALGKPTSIAFDATRGLIWSTEYNTGIIAYANTTFQNLANVPTSSSCLILPSTELGCASPAGYAETNVMPTITNAASTSTIRNALATSIIDLYQGPINGLSEYRLPIITAQPNFVSVDFDGNVWFTESNTTVNRLGRVRLSVNSTYADFMIDEISGSPNPLTLYPGQCANLTFLVQTLGAFRVSVALDMQTRVPLGIKAQFSPYVTLPMGSVALSNLQICVAPGTPAGQRILHVVGTGNTPKGQITHSFTLGLNVENPVTQMSVNRFDSSEGGSSD